MFELGPEKLIFLFLLALLFFGGKRIPEIGASLGKGIREFKRGMKDLGDGVQEEEPTQVRPAAALPPASSVAYEESRPAPKRLIDN